MKKPKKIKVPKKLPKPFKRAKAPEERVDDALRTVPRITNETVSEHREEVLSTARKYIYPLQHSKHKVVRTSVILLVGVLLVFFAYCGLALYKFQSTSGFIYGVTSVVPFPAAKAGPSWVSYESYLFELRRNMHYYKTQQQADFSSKTGKVQLNRLKQQAMAQVTQDAYVKQLAKQYNVSVSNQAVNDEVALVRSENRLGSSDRVFKDVLNEFWGWDVSDFKRELKQQMLQQAVVAKLSTKTNDRAQEALAKINSGTDFGAVAAQYSDDASTKATGGKLAVAVSAKDRNLAPGVAEAIFKLKPGQTSGIINTGYSLEILKLLEVNGGTAQAAHVQFIFPDIKVYIKPVQAKQPTHTYVKFSKN